MQASRGSIRDGLKERDTKINELIEELGNTQAMLSDKTAELAQACPNPLLFATSVKNFLCLL